jgi:hypothetical protein
LKTAGRARLVAALVVVVAVGIASSTLGPARRKFAAKPQVLAAASVEEIAALWASLGVKGRLAVLFTRRLNAVEPGERGTAKFMEDAMHEGIVREAWHVVPDAAWPEVSANLDRRAMTRKNGAGYLLLFEEVRANVLPLSAFERIPEEALVVVDASIWAPEALETIARMLRERRLAADCVAVLHGDPAVVARLAEAVAH